MLLQHFLKRDRQAGGQAAQALAQLEGSLALAAILQQQGNQLALGKARLQLRTTLQGAAGHGSQACFGLGHAAFAALQLSLEHFHIARQLRRAFRWRGRLGAGVGVAQTLQPGTGQFDLALAEPELAFDQGDGRQVIDRRHVPDMHHPLDLGEVGEGTGVVAQPPLQTCQHAEADHQADVAAGAGFLDAGLEALARLVRLQREAAQVALVKHQPATHGIAPLRGQTGKPRQPLAHFVFGTQHFTACLQYAGTVVMDHGLEQRIAEALRQLQRFSVEAARAPQIVAHDGQVAQRRQAQQARAEAFRAKAVHGLFAVALGRIDLAAATGNHSGQSLPLRQQIALGRGIGGGQEARQLRSQFLRRIQLAGQRQRPAVQHDQTRRAGQQAVGQVHLPAQQRGDVLLGQQLFFGKALYQARRDFRMAGAQGLLHRVIEQSLGAEPAARAKVQRSGGRP